jgi:hypothetical protein
MSTWIIPNRTKEYDARKGLSEFGDEIEWTKKLATTNIAAGDTVYLYEAKPRQELIIELVVTDPNIITPRQTHRNDGTIVGDRWFKIKFVRDIKPIAFEVMLSLGVVNGNIQAARLLKPEQESALMRIIATSGNNEA